MKEAIGIIHSEAALLEELQAKQAALRETLTGASPGPKVAEAVRELDRLLGALSRLQATERRFLTGRGSRNMSDYVQAQPASEERDVALRLLFRLEDLEWLAKEDLATNRRLLERGRDFVAYHMNILSETRADDTYGSGGNTGTGTTQGRKMFEANV